MTTEATIADSYNDVPYPSGPQPHSHPCHLAMVAALFGQPTTAIGNCRVLELGCASGGNLIPMALNFPGSHFVGIDLSSRQIADGQSMVDQLSINNIELRHQSILEFTDDIEPFDYIICHGVFSWVPRAVQDRILSIGRDLLTQQGIMYVSYNTYPGWHLRGTVRDMMRYHSASFRTADEKLSQCRSLLKFLIESAKAGSETYRQILKDEAEHLNGHDDAYIYHEHLEENNEPFYFHQFMERVTEQGLRYLGDADFTRMLTNQFDDETAAILSDAPLLRQEQYIDFLTARSFRCSLLCRPSLRLDRNVTPSRLFGLSLSLSEPLQIADENSAETRFMGRSHSASTSQPVLKAVLRELVRHWPAWEKTERLLELIQLSLAGSPSTELRANILEDLLLLLSRGMVEAKLEPPAVAMHPGQRPLASPWARLQSREGMTAVTNRRHMPVELSQLHHFVLSKLDGEQDRQQLSSQLLFASVNGSFKMVNSDQTATTLDHYECDKLLEKVLGDLTDSTLLEPSS